MAEDRQSSDPSSRELGVSIHIEALPAHVWEIMTQRMEEWWCPRPWRVELVEMDWRAGGRCAMTMHGPAGETFPSEGVFLEVTPGVRWVSTDAFTPGWMPAGPFMVGFWEIAPQDNGTCYRAYARHWTDEAREQHEQMGFIHGWQAVAEQLKALCEAGS